MYHIHMTPRGTDWTLGTLAALLFATGMLSLVSGRTGDAWVFALHGIGGAALGLVTGWKLRRVWRRLVALRHWDRRTWAGASTTLFVLAAIASGVVWSNGGDLYLAGWNLLNWHIALGVLLTIGVAAHALLRAKPLRRRDLQQRRQFLHLGAIGAAAAGTWLAQRPLAERLGWRGAQRRWTGSYERGSFAGNAFPTTSWIADRPQPLAADTYRLVVDGLVGSPLSLPLSALHNHDTLTATLDCTGGFYSTQHWHGIALDRLLAQAETRSEARYVRVIGVTGYRWSFPIQEASSLLLATAVGDEALSHGHGAPVRLVAPGRRGFQWIKWVTRIELHADPDYGAAASTVWSSWTPEGRGAA
jgi:DMSO/TMAO reductase YedYZ molybdopterin-dependent catalytic subunit